MVVVWIVAGFCAAPALEAQAQSTCNWTTLQNPTRQVIRCGGDALALEREAGSILVIQERQGAAVPREIGLEEGAALIDVAPGAARTQIRTPHAIAAVRGTSYVVDAGPNATSVFVIEGQVDVRKTGNPSTVTLGPGEGVDVSAEQPLQVVRWGSARVAALLARFGR